MSTATTLTSNNSTGSDNVEGFDFENADGVYRPYQIPDVSNSGTIPRIKRKGSAISSPQKTTDSSQIHKTASDVLQETEDTEPVAQSQEDQSIKSERKAGKQVSKDETVVNLSGSEDDSEPASENEVERDCFDDAGELRPPVISRLAEMKLDQATSSSVDNGVHAATSTTQETVGDAATSQYASSSDKAEANSISHVETLDNSQRNEPASASSGTQSATAVNETVQLQQIEVEEDDEVEAGHHWLRRHTRHVFVLSDSGKPIYTRHGREDKLVTEMGLIKALFDFVADARRTESLQVLRTDDCLVVYLVRHHLVLVGVSHAGESPTQIAVELSYVFSYIVSQLTVRQIDSIFTKRPNFDLRRLLTDADRCVGQLLERFETDSSLLLGAYRTLPLAAPLREQIQTIISTTARDPELAFALLLADAQLVTTVRIRDKKCDGHPLPADVHLLVNMVQTNSALRHGEFWAPVCLPSFDAGYFLYCYVHFLDERADIDPAKASSVAAADQPKICLLLLSVSNDKFFQLSKIQRLIKEKFEKQNLIAQLIQAVERSVYTLESLGHFGNPELWHFVYRHRACAQVTSPTIGLPYSSLVRAVSQRGMADASHSDGSNTAQSEDDEQTAARYILARYSRVHKYLHSQVRPFRNFIQRMHHETVCGILTNEYELYALFSPYTSLPIIAQTVQRISRWAKQDESRLFALQTWPVFAP